MKQLGGAPAESRAGKMIAELGAMSEFVIAICRPALEQHSRLRQVTRWATGTRVDGSAEVIKRQRMVSLLSQQP